MNETWDNVPVRPAHAQQEYHQRILRAWLKTPELRLGQLIHNATHTFNAPELYYVEDEELVSAAEKYAAEHESPNAHNPDPARVPPVMKALDQDIRGKKSPWFNEDQNDDPTCGGTR